MAKFQTRCRSLLFPLSLAITTASSAGLWTAASLAADKPVAAELRTFCNLRNQVESTITFDLEAMAKIAGINPEIDPQQQSIRKTLRDSLLILQQLYENGEINPFLTNLVTEGPTGFVKTSTREIARPLRIAYFPVAADPFHWAHLLTALEAMAQLKLDKVVFIVAGRDARKPDLTDADLRHPLAKKEIGQFGEFFAYSDIALQAGINDPEPGAKPTANGTNDGETNIFHDLARNRHLPITAYYLVGSDHFNWTVEKKGRLQDDTVKKIEDNMKKPHLGFSAAQGKHRLVAAFIARNADEISPQKIAQMKAMITYDLQVVVPSLSYASTQIRNYFKGITPDGKQPLNFLPISSYQVIMDHGFYRK